MYRHFSVKEVSLHQHLYGSVANHDFFKSGSQDILSSASTQASVLTFLDRLTY
jgi:hypothetical protein